MGGKMDKFRSPLLEETPDFLRRTQRQIRAGQQMIIAVILPEFAAAFNKFSSACIWEYPPQFTRVRSANFILEWRSEGRNESASKSVTCASMCI